MKEHIPAGLKNSIKDLLWHPGPIRYGRASWIRRPVYIEGGRFIQVGDRVFIRAHGYLAAVRKWGKAEHTGHITIGDDTYIGRYAYITAAHRVAIGRGCVLSEHVYITDHAHGLHPEGGPVMLQALESKGPVVLGDRVFVGYRASILPGVTLGDNCVVGASSVVTRSFPAGSMVAGAPARLLKRWNGTEWASATE